MKPSAVLGPVILDLQGPELLSDEHALLQHPQTGGVIFFKRNYESHRQITQLVADIKRVRPELLLTVDQEGGRVQRFGDPFTRLPPMQKIGSLYRMDAAAGLAAADLCGWLMAAELLSVGLDISFAPVLDVDDNFSDVIGDRAFSNHVDEVACLAAAFIKGMNRAGMAATAKHFPGHGSVKADSHVALPSDYRPFEDIMRADMHVFIQLRDQVQAMMPAHIRFPCVDDQPVGFSSRWLRNILKGDLGFQGVIFSDDLSMAGAAVAGDYPARAAQALAAGCDALLVCNNPEGAHAILEYLEQRHYAGSGVLSRLRAHRPADNSDLHQLRETTAWVEARTAVDTLWQVA